MRRKKGKEEKRKKRKERKNCHLNEAPTMSE
jgi:hypothetical protein